MDPHKPFKVITSRNLDHDYRAILSLLYTPLISSEGVALYHAFYALVDRSQLRTISYPHDFLFDLLSMTPTSFHKTRRKLEATGLLSTHSKEDDVVYRLYLPLSAESFIKDSPFAPYLHKAVGEERYQELIEFFKIKRVILSQYEDITTHFDDVFEPVQEKQTTRSKYLETTHRDITLRHAFNADLLIESLPQNLVHPQTKTQRAKERFKQLSYVYNLDESDLKTLILQSLNNDTTIDYQTLTKRCANSYQAQPKKQYHKRQEMYDAEYFKSTDPRSVYLDITGMDIPVADAKIIDDLISKTDLNIEVLNVLIAYVLKELNQQFPVYNYFEKIVAEWKRHSIESVDEAIAFIKQKIAKRKETKTTTSRSKKELPNDVEIDWFDAYLKKREEES